MFSRIKFISRLFLAYIKRFRGLIVGSILVGIAIFFAMSSLLPLISKKVERIGITGRYRSEELPDYILRELGRGLTKVDVNGEIEGDLAESWDVLDSGRTWVFHLEDEVYWQDGAKVASSDIVYNFSDVQVDMPDSLTIAFRLKDPFSPFPSVVTKPIFKKGLLGVGEWKIKNLRVVGNFVQDLTIERAGKEVRIYKFYPTAEATKTAFKLGKVDKIVNVYDASEFSGWPNVFVSPKSEKGQVVTLFFNTQEKFFADKSVRQALTYAIDKDSLGERALSPISENSWAYNAQVKEYSLDKERAEEILKDLPDELKNLQVTLISAPDLLPTADKIAESWKGIGVETKVTLSSFVPSDFQVFLTILDVPDDPDQYSLWHSTQTTSNISKYVSPRVDKLLEEGRTQLDTEERKKIYLDFQRFLLEDLPAAFLYYPTYYEVSR